MSELPVEQAELELEDTLRDKYLTFRLASEDYGLEIRHVTEIIGIQRITPVPNTPDYVKGVINLRGRVIPIMDVRLRFHMVEREYDERTCVVVVRTVDNLVGLIVDTVSEVLSISTESIQAPPGRTSTQGHFIQGLGKHGDSIKILLDVAKLLEDEDLNLAARANVE